MLGMMPDRTAREAIMPIVQNRSDGCCRRVARASGRNTVTEGESQASDPLRDRAQVRMFTLADYVGEELSGKLYISGAGLEWTGLPVHQDMVPPFYLAIRLAFPMAMAGPSHVVEIRALQADGSPAGPDPVLVRAKMHFNVDQAPEFATELSGNLPIQIMNYSILVESNSVMFLHLSVDGVLVRRVPVQLRPADEH
jgi:hypothetical protein